MKDSCFYDTSILVYAYDESEKNKREVCKKLVEDIFKGERTGIVSNQVLAELFNVLTRHMHSPISKDDAGQIINEFANSQKWKKINYTTGTIRAAIATSKIINSQSIWDPLIAETMKENGIIELVTENEKDFNKIQGIKVINPFK